MLTEIVRQRNNIKAVRARIAAAGERYMRSKIEKITPGVEPTAKTVSDRKEPWFYEPAKECHPTHSSIIIIQNKVCRYFGIQHTDLKKQRRAHEIVRPRQIAMYLCREHTAKSLPEIGRMFGGYDHTTVLSNCRVTEKRIKSDWEIAYDVAHIERLLL